MGNPKNVISLNGKIYDVTTGTLANKLSPFSRTSRESKPSTANKTRKPNQSSNKVVDGIRAPSKKASNVKKSVKSKSHSKRNVKHISSRKTERPKTLMRSLVKKPNPSDKQTVRKASGPISPPKFIFKQNAKNERQKRAVNAKKSKHVEKFSSSSPNVIKKTMPLSVKSPNTQKTKTQVSQISDAINSAKAGVQSSIKSTEDIFTKALEKAKSHEEPPVKGSNKSRKLKRKLQPKKRSSKILLSLVIAILVFGGLFLQFWPNIKIRIASVKSGISASIPGYTPAGFSRESIDFGEGEVNIAYKSNNDDRKYIVRQSVSNWNSETLFDTYVKPKAKQYQTIEDQGKTIYTYDDSNATWVNGGIWYKITGNDSLSSEQILKIADSL